MLLGGRVVRQPFFNVQNSELRRLDERVSTVGSVSRSG